MQVARSFAVRRTIAIRVLNNGTEVFDVSNISPDHAPSVSTLLSQSIEVVRGPATILYGSGAIGGVVNVTDNLIPVGATAHTDQWRSRWPV